MNFGRGWSSQGRRTTKNPPPGATLNDWPPPVSTMIPKDKDVPLGNPRFNVVILSKDASNLRLCLRGLFQQEPGMIDKVIVVDDGAKKDLEDLPGVIWESGQKPFVFARNSNIGIRRAGAADVILLNDDAILQTPRGFTHLAQAARERSRIGLCSAGIAGHVGNENQYARHSKGVRLERKKLAFVCVYITRAMIDKVGLLDERFVGYGYEDDDFSTRALRDGFGLGVFDGCVVEHASIPSSFRARPDYAKLITENRLRYESKWSNLPPTSVQKPK